MQASKCCARSLFTLPGLDLGFSIRKCGGAAGYKRSICAWSPFCFLIDLMFRYGLEAGLLHILLLMWSAFLLIGNDLGLIP